MSDQVWKNITVIRRWFDLQMANMDQRGVRSRPGPNNTTEYCVDDVIEKCGDLIMKRFTPRDVRRENHKIKELLLAEQIRKLKIANDEAEGILVSAFDVEQSYTRSIRAICDVLDSLPSRIKMEHPDVSQSHLDAINQALIAVRNEAAALNFD